MKGIWHTGNWIIADHHLEYVVNGQWDMKQLSRFYPGSIFTVFEDTNDETPSSKWRNGHEVPL